MKTITHNHINENNVKEYTTRMHSSTTNCSVVPNCTSSTFTNLSGPTETSSMYQNSAQGRNNSTTTTTYTTVPQHDYKKYKVQFVQVLPAVQNQVFEQQQQMSGVGSSSAHVLQIQQHQILPPESADEIYQYCFNYSLSNKTWRCPIRNCKKVLSEFPIFDATSFCTTKKD